MSPPASEFSVVTLDIAAVCQLVSSDMSRQSNSKGIHRPRDVPSERPWGRTQ